MTNHRYPLFVKGDLDGFFGLFIDNLVQLLLIVALCNICGIPADSPLLLEAIFPGVAVSLLLGNVFYAWQARRLAKRTNQNDITALPYGINTPSLLVYVYFVMLPAFGKASEAGLEDPARFAWQMGLIACLGSGVIEFGGAFIAGYIRRRTPRAALLSTLAGIAIGFISMKFTLDMFQRPLVSMLALAVVLLTYFSRVGFPLSLPGGFVAVLLGAGVGWFAPFVLPESLTGPAMSWSGFTKSTETAGFYLPQFAGDAIWEVLSDSEVWLGYLSVIVPMGLFNLVGSLQNIESAAASGDEFDTRSSLAANGVGTIAAAFFGSCFPTTIYIGHPGWKGMGARAGYSTLNGLVVTIICLTGTVTAISNLIPLEAGIGILLWIGVIITSQSFQETPREHAPAVAIGLFPAIAAWGATIAQGAFIAVALAGEGGISLEQFLANDPQGLLNGFLAHGLLVMERGYIFTGMILAAISANLIDKKFFTAAVWSLVACLFTVLGLMHAYQISGNSLDFLFIFQPTPDAGRVYRAFGVAIGWGLFAVLFFAYGWWFTREANDPAKVNAETLATVD
ncbi:NCS2 family permease [Thalassoroseus pseudoceratinae]|uniref:NCS2 family permease n=1 Tax=Thalassoroseus pseudoceratinae TaxID=2713176 RepID=UPI00197D9FF2|nr:NCS2 family permease [Thalassoroseus pseudoceratinae]